MIVRQAAGRGYGTDFPSLMSFPQDEREGNQIMNDRIAEAETVTNAIGSGAQTSRSEDAGPVRISLGG